MSGDGNVRIVSSTGGRGGTNEKENMTDTAEVESAQRVREVDESVKEERSRMRVTQKRNCLGQNYRLHRLQVQEGKPDRERPSPKMLEGEVTEVLACQEKTRQYGQDRGEEKDDNAGRSELWRQELRQHQPIDGQTGTLNKELLRVTQTVNTTSRGWNAQTMGA